MKKDPSGYYKTIGIQIKGEGAGHEFRGNQYSGGGGSGKDDTAGDRHPSLKNPAIKQSINDATDALVQDRVSEGRMGKVSYTEAYNSVIDNSNVDAFHDWAASKLRMDISRDLSPANERRHASLVGEAITAAARRVQLLANDEIAFARKLGKEG
jgi:hypothetical protein